MREIAWRGFSGCEFTFEGNSAKVIKPNCKPNGKWLLKAEYFDAFPETEIELLNRGWHLAYNENDNRWAEEADMLRKCAFVEFVPKAFGLEEKCVLVGMSCGGMYSVKLASMIPNRIRGLYLDAPVMNLLSCPGNLGRGNGVPFEEYVRLTGRTMAQLISYRNHPMDKMHVLAEHKLPILLVSGDSDGTVPYEENGALLESCYRERGLPIEVIIKAGCDHHPHGVENPSVLADVIEKF